MAGKLFTATAAAAFAVAFGSAASAAVLVDVGVGGHLTYHLHNTADATEPVVTLDVQGESYLVDLAATTGGNPDDLNQGGAGGGFAIVNGTPLFDTVLIDPTNFAGFDELQFFLAYQPTIPNPTEPPPNLGINYGSFTLAYTFVGGGGGSTTVTIENGNQRFRLFGNNNEVFSTVTLSNLQGTAQDGHNDPLIMVPADFENIRQVSFEAAAFDPCFSNPTGPGCGVTVPEPGTWALMIVGFGAVGYAIRRRRYAFAPA